MNDESQNPGRSALVPARGLDSPFTVHHSSFRAFAALVALTFRRHWRVRSLGWVTLGLLGLLSAVVAVVTHGPVGWRLERQPVWVTDTKPLDERGRTPTVRMTYRQYGEDRLTFYQFLPGP